MYFKSNRDTRWRSWLRHCATSRKVAGSIPDGVTAIFHSHNPSGRTMVLVLTQPLTQKGYQEYFLGAKGVCNFYLNVNCIKTIEHYVFIS